MSANRQPSAGLTITLWTVIVFIAAAVTMAYALTQPTQVASAPTVTVPTKIKRGPPPGTPAIIKPAPSWYQHKKGIKPLEHDSSPSVDPSTLLTLQVKLENQSRSLPAYLVASPGGTFILTTASRLTQPEWSSLSEVTVMHGTKTLQLAKQPDWLGSLTHDNHPNMLQSPDLSDDLAWWRCPDPSAITLLNLRQSVLEKDEPVWLLTRPSRWIKARVIRSLPNQVDVNVLERVEIDQLIGGIILDEKHAFAGTILGGNDDIATGAPSTAILRKLK